MANTFSNFLKNFSSNVKALSKTTKTSVGFIDKAVKVKEDAIKQNKDKLKSSLITINPTNAEPTKENLKSIMFDTSKKTGLSDWQSKAKQVLDHKKSLITDTQLSPLGAPTKPQTTTQKQKDDALEFMRSGKITSEIEEIKKEWLMEETKVRWDALNPFLSYEDAQNNPNWKPWFENAEKKWDKLWETDRESLVPSLETITKESLVQEAEKKDEWIRDQVPYSLGTLGIPSASTLRERYPDWYAKKEQEYYKTQAVSAYMGLAIKSFDSSLTNLLGKDQMAEMEVSQALMGGADPKKTFTAMTLDVINFEDIANIGQDVYTKDGKIYYKGFEIDDEYLTDAGKQTAMATNLIARFTGGIAPYAGISGLIKKSVFAIARAKDVPRILTGAQKLSQAIKWSSEMAPLLTEMTTFNTLEELTDMAIRKGSGQKYTFNDFIAGITMGAGFAGTLTLLGKSVDTVKLKNLVRTMELNVKDSKDINSLRNLRFEGRTLDDLYLAHQQIYYKGLNKSDVTPGVNVSAPLPEAKNMVELEKTNMEDPLLQEAKKYKSAEEFVKAQTDKAYRSTHQVDTNIASPITKISNATLSSFVDEFKNQYGYPSLKQVELNKLKSIIENPDKEVIIYRASPKNELNSGDWVTIDKNYANDIKRQNGGKVYTYTVRADDLFYPKTIEGFKDLPSLNKWGAFQYQSSKIKSQLTDIWNKANGSKSEAGDIMDLFDQKTDEFKTGAELESTNKVIKIPEALFGSQKGIEVFNELQTSAAGSRIVTEEGTVGVKSSFPDWVPSDLRSRELFDQVEKSLMEGTVPKTKRAGELYSIVHQRMLGGEGIPKVEVGTSKVGMSMAEKAIENRLTKTFGATAEYSLINIKDQAKRASDLVDKDIDRALRIMNGEEKLPPELRGASVLTALEDYAIKSEDVELLRSIAKSPLASETSLHAQEMRLLAERDPFSPVTKIKEVTAAREAAVIKKMKGRTTIGVKSEMRVDLQKKIAKAKPTPKTWAALLDELTC